MNVAHLKQFQIQIQRTADHLAEMTEVTSERTNFSSETLPENGTNSSRNCHLSEIQVFPKEVKFLIHVFTLVVALVGNSLLIAAYRRMKEPVMLLIANMAASDLLTAIFLIPRLMTIAIVDSFAWQVHGLAGTVLCKMCTFLSDISLSVSTQSLVIIAVERFIAVVHPLKARSITAKERRLLIASTWIAAMALHSPYFYCMEIVINNNNIPICENKWITDQQAFLAFNIFLFVTILLVPLVTISILYPIILVYIRRDKMAPHRSSKAAKRSRKRNMKLLKMAAATVLSIFICWVPYAVITFLELFAPSILPTCNRVVEVTAYISRVLASSYCAFNPFVCFIFLRNFRGELCIIFKRRKRHSTTTIDSKISARSGSSTFTTEF